MADAKPTKPNAASSLTVDVFDGGAKAKPKANKAQAFAGVEGGRHAAAPPEHGGHLRRVCCGLALVAAAAAVAVLVLSLTVLKVRDPTLSMDSVTVKSFNVHFGDEPSRPLKINVTLLAGIVIRNPNYESMRFGASSTEIFVDGVPECVGLGAAPPGLVPARGASTVRAGVDVFVDKVGPAIVGEVLFGGGEVRLESRTAVDGRISVLGGLYGRRTVRVAMRCRVLLRVSAAVVAAGPPACVADFGH